MISPNPLLYINVLPTLTQSNTFLFADEINMFRSIMNRDDQSTYTKTGYNGRREIE